MQRQLTPLDHFIAAVDEGLRHAVGEAPSGTRENPAGDVPDVDMDENTRKHVAGLMRINHAGEVCAQALYAGQAATARSETVRREMETAAAEEIDHLAWCAERLRELDDQPSVLNPLWYAGSFAIGAAAGLAGDAWSLGFLKETENQVEAHLAEHLDRLPEDDRRSNAILAQMKIDEARHADMAEQSGARDLPLPVTGAMRLAAGVMKAIVYRI
jgi:ubiquinone biosynthesis monooxygenase Coq7